ncbi:DUF3899 domain-containing protein [Fictibacillus terranigra]|uniref:DUF3899 domain-containing protein n=1 Tax=Fictibacillus terranigra TaxID=3058424 RepID=A0ABT8E732_9BACL|nr:DUF3899 domain-containing protein [Fictibacillus sp. CENA-BCM004]MDN4073700.1 DUF3899 domain-containing protein [Fictibacillus sp. CENA-BCM004]
MSRLPSTWLLTAGSILLALAIEFVSEKKVHFIHLINNLFMVSLALIIIGLALFVVKGGFFDLFSRAFRKVLKSFSKSAEYADSQEAHSNFELSERISGDLVFPLLASGFFIFLLSSLVAILA